MGALNEYFHGQAVLKDLEQKGKDGTYAPYAELEPVLEGMRAQGFDVTIDTGVYASNSFKDNPILYSSLKIEKNSHWIAFSHNLGRDRYSERTSDRFELITLPDEDFDLEYTHEEVSDLKEVAARIGYWQEKNKNRFVPATVEIPEQRRQGWAVKLAAKIGLSLG